MNIELKANDVMPWGKYQGLTLRAVYKNTMLITRERKKSASEESKSLKGEIRKKSKLDLFKDFYEAYGNSDYNDKKESVLVDTINEVLKGEAK